MFAALVYVGCAAALLAAPIDRGCEARPEVKEVLDRYELGNQPGLAWAEKTRLLREVIDPALTQYPDDIHLHRRYLDRAFWYRPEEIKAIRESYRRRAAREPENASALYLGGVALFGFDTEEALRLFERAIEKDASFAWPHLDLARAHSYGRFADAAKKRAHLEAFFAACPDSLDSQALSLLTDHGAPELQQRVAAAVRKRLARSTDAKDMQAHSTLWGIEFRQAPVAQHGELRRRVAADVERLERMTAPDAAFFELVRNGLKQSGAPSEKLRAIDDRLLEKFPNTEAAINVLRTRWRDANKQPNENASAEEWDRWNAAEAAALEGWMKRAPRDFQFAASYFGTLRYIPATPPEKLLGAGEQLIRNAYNHLFYTGDFKLEVAEALLERGYATPRVLALIEEGIPDAREDWERRFVRDNDTDDRREGRERWRQDMENDWIGLRLKACRLLGKPELAAQWKPAVESPEPERDEAKSRYWWNRGLLAWAEGRRADAVACYVKAVQTRKDEPRRFFGRIHDPLKDELGALWREMKGSPETLALLTAPAGPKRREEQAAGWLKPKKALPAFELADLKGSTWRLKALEGRTLLINSWATWCGPCKAELPNLQKLYDRVKERNDIAVLSLNVDEEVGLVEPFLKEKGYTFPVLLGYSFFNGLYPDGWGIPQNWVVDKSGNWIWSDVGFDRTSASWADDVLALLERTGKH